MNELMFGFWRHAPLMDVDGGAGGEGGGGAGGGTGAGGAGEGGGQDLQGS